MVNTRFGDLTIDKDKDGKLNITWCSLTLMFAHMMAVFLAGKMDFEEFQAVTIEGLKKYFDGLRKTKSRLRSRNSQQTWLWHDEDELLQYEDLFEDYHDR